MKIVHVEDYFDPSAGYQINELLIASKEFDDDVYLITSNDMSPFHKEVDINKDRDFEQYTGVKIIRLNKSLKLSSRLILKNFKKKINEIKPDVIYMHGIGDFKDFLLWSPKPNYKIIRDCHMSWVASKNKFRKLFYLVYKIFFASIINNTNKYEVIYALGNEEYEYLKRIGISEKKIDFLRHGYNDLIMFYDEKERRRVRDQYSIEDNDIVISYIGKFNNFKKPDLIIDIINMLDKEFIDSNKLKLLFIGPKDKNYMIRFNEKLASIKGKIPIVIDESKQYNELRKYYSASDICIFPKETTLSSIHAQVCGCPVIMENHESNRERVINNNNLFEIDDIEQAKEILRKIVEEQEYLKDKQERNTILLKDREYKRQIELFKKRI